MTDENTKETETTETEKRRIEIKDLPQPEQELTAEEEKQVKGGGFASSTLGNRGIDPNNPNNP